MPCGDCVNIAGLPFIDLRIPGMRVDSVQRNVVVQRERRREWRGKPRARNDVQGVDSRVAEAFVGVMRVGYSCARRQACANAQRHGNVVGDKEIGLIEYVNTVVSYSRGCMMRGGGASVRRNAASAFIEDYVGTGEAIIKIGIEPGALVWFTNPLVG